MLEGRLDDFSLPDVFQLLALTGKTGTLRLRYADTAGAVVFRAGRVVAAFDDVRRTAPGTRMFASGLIDESQLEAAIEASEAGAEGGVLGALVAAGAVDEDTVAEFRRQQAEDAVFALMRLTEATFSIEAGDVPPLPGEVELNTEQLIVEGGRRLGEWTEIRRRVPGRQSVPALVPDPPGEGPVTVGRDQWRLLALIDGRRTVADLVDLLGSGEYTTAAELSGLVDAGMITVGDRATHAQGARTRGERLREFEARELGLLRDDPAATPEVAPQGVPAAPADAAAGDAAAGAGHAGQAGDDAADAADAGDDRQAAERPAAAEAGDDPAQAQGETPRRSALQATLISGIEIYDDLEDLDAAQQATAGGAAAAHDGGAASAPDDELAGDGQRRGGSDGEAEEPPVGEQRTGAQPDAPPAKVAPGQTGRAGEEQPPAAAAGAGDAGTADTGAAHTGAGDAVSQAPPPPSHGPLPAPHDQPRRSDEAPAPGWAPEGDEPAVEGLDDAETPSEGEADAESGLTRDEDINKALLLRLIDGVKGV